jgi:hypothetical protein
VARLGLMALGLSFAGALASIPGTASADSSDWLTAVDSYLSGVPLSAATDDLGLNVAISYNGMTLFQDGTASASSGTGGDFAVAYGADSSASATGSDNYAAVYGEGSHAAVSGASTNSAVVLGNDSSAVAGGAGSSGNLAFVYGEDSAATAGGYGNNPGNLNIAGIVGDHNIADAGSNASNAGSDNIAYVEGNDVGTANATGSSDLVDIDKYYDNWGQPTAPTIAAAAESTNVLSGSDASGALADGNSFWSDLLSGDTAGAVTSGNDFWADLATSFDGGSVAADASNVWTELATLF